ncbi:MAG: VOC family protein [Proteobacteria bacterium]|nr:VOC family protein [Pseudomonadota bacterium]
MGKYTGIHHLALITDDMDKTIRFWRDLLGMKMLAATGDGQNKQYYFEICENTMISFFEWPESTNPEKKHHGVPTIKPLAFDHVAIGVENDVELSRLKKLLESAGFKASHVVDHGYFHSVYAFDPNSIPIEFTTDVKGKSLREIPRMSDRNIGDIALEGHDPQPDKWPLSE